MFIVDNSDSMVEEATALAIAASSLVFPQGSLVSITTTEGDGAPVGPPVQADYATLVPQQLLCEATCFSAAAVLPSDGAYACGDPFSEITVELLDCLCPASWRGNCGSANEQGLAAADAAFADPLMVPADHSAHFIVLTDEGDSSSDLAAGDPSVGLYEAQLAGSVFSAIAPDLDANDRVRCPGVATDWGVQRYQTMATLTGGQLLPIQDATCETVDIGAAITALLASSQ